MLHIPHDYRLKPQLIPDIGHVDLCRMQGIAKYHPIAEKKGGGQKEKDENCQHCPFHFFLPRCTFKKEEKNSRCNHEDRLVIQKPADSGKYSEKNHPESAL